ncbi:MAG TPA: sigma-54 dependent transcriptional regulator [Candidatus Methylomirabilis sp.]|jgi:DNA-binding NtrC family response regulator
MSEPIRVLVVDDDPALRELFQENLEVRGCAVKSAGDGQEGLDLLRAHAFDVVLVDLNMPRLNGMSLLRKMKEEEMEAEAIVLTGNAELETAIEAMKLGAFDYLTKPCRIHEMEVVIRKAFDRRQMARENRALRRMVAQREEAPALIAQSPAMRRVLADVEKVAGADSPVLILGESGTGKELIARAIVQQSERAGKPFLAVNCGAFQDELLESELFGHEKGAFTGAVAQRHGLFEVAHGGSLLLDEVGEMSTAMQAKLLRVLEDGEIRRVGSTRVQRVDVRVIAATNRDLAQDVEAGRFRKDLFYRLHVLTLSLPPLRERPEDIPILIAHFMGRTAGRRPPKRLSEEALSLLTRHQWPGNIRELENVVARLVVFCERDVIEASDLPPTVRAPAPPAAAAGEPDPQSLRQMERLHIAKVLAQCGGNKSRAARALGIDIKTLASKIKSYGIGT